MTTAPLVIRSKSLSKAVEVPRGLEGRETERFGFPVRYFKKEAVRAGDWCQRSDGRPFEITRERIDQWVDSTKRLMEAGAYPYLPNHHRFDVDNLSLEAERDSIEKRKNFGRVIDIYREGDSLYAELQVVGDEALAAIASNDVSICVPPNVLDAKGRSYGPALQHLAIVPNPNQPHLEPFVMIAASAGGDDIKAEILELAADGEPKYKFSSTQIALPPDMASALLELGKQIPDEDLAEDGRETDAHVTLLYGIH